PCQPPAGRVDHWHGSDDFGLERADLADHGLSAKEARRRGRGVPLSRMTRDQISGWRERGFADWFSRVADPAPLGSRQAVPSSGRLYGTSPRIRRRPERPKATPSTRRSGDFRPTY